MRNPFNRDPSVADRIHASRAQYEQKEAARAREHDDYEREANQAREARRSFLRETNAAPAPPHLYAAWLAVWVSQGGSIRSHNRGDLTQLARPGDYDSPFVYWVPRRPFRQIPTGYGANSMNMLVLPTVTGGNLGQSSGDHRQGWEYGHSTVLTLDVAGDSLHAGTNQPDTVESFRDVERIIDTEMDMQSLSAAVLRLTGSKGEFLELPRQE